jgi:hypothetical protein
VDTAGRAKPEGLAYLEAVRAFARMPTRAMRPHEWGARRSKMSLNFCLKQKKFDSKCNQHGSSYGAYQTAGPVRYRASKRRHSVRITRGEIFANESYDNRNASGNDEYCTHIFPI